MDTLSYSFSPTSPQNAYKNNSDYWQKIAHKPLNLGFEQRPVWLSFTVKNTLSVKTSPLLSLDNPLLNEVQVYHFYETSNSFSKVVSTYDAGKNWIDQSTNQTILTNFTQ